MARYSEIITLDAEIESCGGQIPLAWVSSYPELPLANFGDALSPVVVSAMTGLPCFKRPFDMDFTRIAAVGTIGHEQNKGDVHIWGSGVDPRRNVVNSTINSYVQPADTKITVHAVRGPFSRKAFEKAGVTAPEVYGDPGCFLPKIFAPNVPKKYELGVIVHVSELRSPSTRFEVLPRILRYNNADPTIIRLISTYHDPSWTGFTSKLEEILSCKRIVSTSFHGLILPELYGIPSLHLHGRDTGGLRYINVLEASYDYLDHRIADYYAGQGTVLLPVYSQQGAELTEWSRVIDDIDSYWEPPKSNTQRLYESFPLIKTVSLDAEAWPLSHALISSLIW